MSEEIEKHNSCTSKGLCSLPPSMVALKVVSFVFIQCICFYILELEKNNAKNINIRNKVLNYILSLSQINENSEDEFFVLLKEEYYLYLDTKRNFNTLFPDISLKFKPELNICDFKNSYCLSDTIKLGEKIISKYLLNSNNYLFNILIIELYSISYNMLNYSDYKGISYKYYSYLFNIIIRIYNCDETPDNFLLDIRNLAQLNMTWQLLFSKTIIKKYLGIFRKRISFSTTKGKSILVSGDNIFELAEVLELLKDTDISVYTHSDLIVAHLFKNLIFYKNLKGHYESEENNSNIELSTFPGPVILTRNINLFKNKLYRGLLYSSETLIPKGYIKFPKNNYRIILNNISITRGFKKGRVKSSKEFGMDIKDIIDNFNSIKSKFLNNDILTLFILFPDRTEKSHNILSGLIDKIQNHKYFIINFGKNISFDNTLNININNNISLSMYLLYKYLLDLKSIRNICKFVFMNCNYNIITNLIYISDLTNTQSILRPCEPNIISPNLLKTISDKFNIDVIS